MADDFVFCCHLFLIEFKKMLMRLYHRFL